jgi:hypothetical protein
MELVLPSPAASDWHLVVRLSLYPEWSKLHSYHYSTASSHPSPSKALFTTRTLPRPRDEWDAIQSLSYGIDLLCGRLYN